MELVGISILLVLSSTLASLFWKWWKAGQKDGLPPGPTICDTLLTIIRNGKDKEDEYFYESLMKTGKKYGGLFTIRLFGRKFLVINDWKNTRNALIGQSEVFAGRPQMYLADKMIQNTDILFSNGPPWKEKRRFTLQHLKTIGVGKGSMESIITNEISRLVDKLEQQVGKKVLINELFFLPILNVLLHIISGKQYDYEAEEINKFSKTLHEMFEYCKLSDGLNFLPWLRFLPSFKKHMQMAMQKHDDVKAFLSDEISEHSKWLQERCSNDEPRDFIDAYVAEMHRPQTKSKTMMTACYTKDHLIGISCNLLHAGIETTVSTLEWSLLYMALWPEIQKGVHDELDRVIGRSRLPNYGDHSLMPYLDATILEIHRFTTVIPLSGLRCTTSSTKLSGFTIPKQMPVMQNLWAVHHDPELWGDPDVFRPERFINGDGKVEKPDYLNPFSLGARKCIGESLARVELFLFLASLLQRFTFSYASGEPLPTLKAKQGTIRDIETLYLIVTER